MLLIHPSPDKEIVVLSLFHHCISNNIFKTCILRNSIHLSIPVVFKREWKAFFI